MKFKAFFSTFLLSYIFWILFLAQDFNIFKLGYEELITGLVVAVIVTSPPNPLELAVNSSADPVFDPHPCSMLSPKAIAILNVTSFFITLLW